MKVSCLKGDITKLDVEVIVNAANTSLLGGSGVDGAIHKAGGALVLEECMKIRNKQGGCKTGEAVITSAGLLPAKYIIHTVGVVWNGGFNDEKQLLKNSYINSLKLAKEHKLESIAFPNISTGIYKFPKREAALIALQAVEEYPVVNQVIFVCYDNENFEIYKELLDNDSRI